MKALLSADRKVIVGGVALAIMMLWLSVYFIHALGFHVLSKNTIDQFSSLGFFGDVVKLRNDLVGREFAEAYAEHMIFSLFLSYISVAMFAIIVVRELILKINANLETNLIPRAFYYSVVGLGCAGLFVLHAGDIIAIDKDGNRLSGAPLWLRMLVLTFMWPFIVVMLFGALLSPSQLQDSLRGR